MNTTETPIIMPDDSHWLSAASCCFGRFASERFHAAARPALSTRRVKRFAGRVRAQALKKRQAAYLEIARRPRGQTEILGHREDGSPIHRYVCAVRQRPYTPPEDRVSVERGAMTIGSMRPHAETRDAGSVNTLAILPRHRLAKRDTRRARMAAKRRRGWR